MSNKNTPAIVIYSCLFYTFLCKPISGQDNYCLPNIGLILFLNKVSSCGIIKS